MKNLLLAPILWLIDSILENQRALKLSGWFDNDNRCHEITNVYL